MIKFRSIHDALPIFVIPEYRVSKTEDERFKVTVGLIDIRDKTRCYIDCQEYINEDRNFVSNSRFFDDSAFDYIQNLINEGVIDDVGKESYGEGIEGCGSCDDD